MCSPKSYAVLYVYKLVLSSDGDCWLLFSVVIIMSFELNKWMLDTNMIIILMFRELL